MASRHGATAQGQLVCLICPSRTGVQSAGHFKEAAHVQRCMEKERQGPFVVCITCGSYSSNSDAAAHLNGGKHSVQLEALAGFKWSCKRCGIICTGLINLQAHMRSAKHLSKTAAPVWSPILAQPATAASAPHTLPGLSAGSASPPTGIPKPTTEFAPTPPVANCRLCDWTGDGSATTYRRHFRSEAHIARYEQLTASHLSACWICGVFCPDARHLQEIHARGRSHLAHKAVLFPDVGRSGAAASTEATAGNSATAAGSSGPSSSKITAAELMAQSQASNVSQTTSQIQQLAITPGRSGPALEQRTTSSSAHQVPAEKETQMWPTLETSCGSRCVACSLTLPSVIALAQHRGGEAHQAKVMKLLKAALGESEATALLSASAASVASGSTNRDSHQLQDMLTCPISQEVMIDPVMAADGFTYERVDITNWLAKSDSSPMTGETLSHRNVVGNASLRAIIHNLQ